MASKATKIIELRAENIKLERRFDMGWDDTPHKDSASVRACKLALACIETGGIHPITPDGQNLRRILREAAGLPVEKGTP